MTCINKFAVVSSSKATGPAARPTGQSDVLADLELSVRAVEEALLASPGCSAGLVVAQQAFGIPVGPSGSPEILAIVHVDDFAYWYGHVMRHPQKEKTYVALLVWSEKMVNATNVPLLFRRFHYWVKDRLCYEPCTVQHEDDAYAECGSLKMAAFNLAGMIRRFHIDLRWPDENGPQANDPVEMRILGIYGLKGAMREDGTYPPLPIATRLATVGTQAGSN